MVEARVDGVLAKALEDKLEAVYNQLFAMATRASAAWWANIRVDGWPGLPHATAGHAGFPGASNKSPAVASSAIVRFANLTAPRDLGALRDAGSLLNALLSSDYRQWLAFVAAHGEQFKALGFEVQKATDKTRLLIDAPSAVIAQAIDVAELEVEGWIIDVIRSGLIQGKMNHVARTLLPTRSTYRTFGADQWKILGERLEQWNASLEVL
ncbi:hypothetical protein FBU31_000596 [Coemansia sp. 'formosensis']|nr:hypothetical protein FBU31_000596 [Coemansia sp. 'formosensis']